MIVVIGALVYVNTLNAPFIYDDFEGIVQNGTIQSLWPRTKSMYAQATRLRRAGRSSTSRWCYVSPATPSSARDH